MNQGYTPTHTRWDGKTAPNRNRQQSQVLISADGALKLDLVTVSTHLITGRHDETA